MGWISLVDSERGGGGAVSDMLTPVKVVVVSRTCRCWRGWWVFVDASKGGARATLNALIPMEEGGGMGRTSMRQQSRGGGAGHRADD